MLISRMDTNIGPIGCFMQATDAVNNSFFKVIFAVFYEICYLRCMVSKITPDMTSSRFLLQWALNAIFMTDSEIVTMNPDSVPW